MTETKKSAPPTTDPTFAITRVFGAPRELVFKGMNQGWSQSLERLAGEMAKM